MTQQELRALMSKHLIANGFTYNAENSKAPVIMREVNLDSLTLSIATFLDRELAELR